MMTSGIYQAFNTPVQSGVIRMVTFLTDGYIGNEADVLALTHRYIGDARLYALGVGTSVNRYLLNELANVGHGFVRYLDPTDNIDEVANGLADKLNTPVLTNITIDWGDLAVNEVTLNTIPDLFAGQSIRIQGQYQTAGEHTIRIIGEINGQEAILPVQFTLADNDTGSTAIPLIWARTKIKSWMDELVKPEQARTQQVTVSHIEKAVTDLGLRYNLMTKWTSFVAVREKIVNHDAANTMDADVPLAQVKGVSSLAYPKTSPMGFSGHATPEPAQWLGLLAGLGCLGLFGALKRRKK